MKSCLSKIISIISIGLGLWLSIYVMFIGGINQIINGVMSVPVNGNDIGWGIIKIVFSEMGFAIPAATGWIIGVLLSDNE